MVTKMHLLTDYLIKELQHGGEDIRVGLLHFIKQDHCLGELCQLLGQLAAIFVALVARGRPNELGHLPHIGHNQLLTEAMIHL